MAGLPLRFPEGLLLDVRALLHSPVKAMNQGIGDGKKGNITRRVRFTGGGGGGGRGMGGGGAVRERGGGGSFPGMALHKSGGEALGKVCPRGVGGTTANFKGRFLQSVARSR